MQKWIVWQVVNKKMSTMLRNSSYYEVVVGRVEGGRSREKDLSLKESFKNGE